MEIFAGHQALFRPLASPAIALGNFDGVHRGHQALLAAAVRAAERLGGDSVVYTFDPHPAAVLAPASAPPLIIGRERKLELIAQAGISVCIIEPFTRELAALSADEFARTILVDIFGARHVVVGYDFSYGHQRGGNAQILRAFGQEHGFAVEIIERVSVDGVAASSTEVRELLRAGEVAGARAILGRWFDVDGTVVRGAGRGRTIGIPTANIAVGTTILPAGGVYAVRMTLLDDDGERRAVLDGVANLGTNPTFTSGQALSLEVHVLDFCGDLYDRRVRVEFIDRLRGEIRFAGVDALVAQIHTDIGNARHILASAPAT